MGYFQSEQLQILMMTTIARAANVVSLTILCLVRSVFIHWRCFRVLPTYEHQLASRTKRVQMWTTVIRFRRQDYCSLHLPSGQIFFIYVCVSDTGSISHWLKEYKGAEMLVHNSLHSRRVARGGNDPPIPNVVPKIFRKIKVLMRKPTKYFSARQPRCLRNLLHQLLVEPDQIIMFSQLSMINQTLCTWGSENGIQGGQ